jgi:hypothetical protein
VDPLAVVIDRNREFLLGGFLSNHVLIEELLYLQRFRNLVGNAGRGFDFIVFQNGIADRNAFVADVGAGIVAGGGNQFADYVLALMAKRTP